METYEELKQSRDQLRADVAVLKQSVSNWECACKANDNVADQLRAEVERLKAELDYKTDRVIAAESMANSLANQIGSIEPHEHPDEQKPRAQTWLQERKNWAAEVSRLRARVAAMEAQLTSLEADKARMDWLASQCYYPYDHPKDGVFIVVSNNVAPHGTFTLERDRDRGALRAAIDAARLINPVKNHGN